MLWTKITKPPEEQLALIFEDDVVLSNNFSTNINKHIENLLNKWDPVYIHALDLHRIFCGTWLKKAIPVMINCSGFCHLEEY